MYTGLSSSYLRSQLVNIVKSVYKITLKKELLKDDKKSNFTVKLQSFIVFYTHDLNVYIYFELRRTIMFDIKIFFDNK